MIVKKKAKDASQILEVVFSIFNNSSLNYFTVSFTNVNLSIFAWF